MCCSLGGDVARVLGRLTTEEIPSWQDLEDIGAGDGPPTECERCGKPCTPRQQFTHMGVTICLVCAHDRSDELASEGSWA